MPDDDGWIVVVALKPLLLAKSRLAPFAGGQLPALALAMAMDTVSAAVATSGVADAVVVSSDTAVAEAMRSIATVVADDGRGLNLAFQHGLSAATRLSSGKGASQGVALLVGDLPALRPAELRAALDCVGTGSLVVADAAGTGSTLLAAREPHLLRPAFGPDSFNRHQSLGAGPLTGTAAVSLRGLRRDVDTADDLAAARALGVGKATARLLRHLENDEGPEPFGSGPSS